MSELENIQKKAEEILQRQNDKSHQKLPENAVSRVQVDIGINAGVAEEKIQIANKKDVFEKIEIWDKANKSTKQSLVLAWMIQNESYISIKNSQKILEQPKDSEIYKNFIAVLEKFIESADTKISSTMTIGNKVKTRYYKPDTEINFILNIVAKELGYSLL